MCISEVVLRDPPIAQLVERWTVEVMEIHRSLVRIRLGGLFLFTLKCLACIMNTSGMGHESQGMFVSVCVVVVVAGCRSPSISFWFMQLERMGHNSHLAEGHTKDRALNHDCV